MLLLDETPYQEPKEALQVAPTGTPKASGMAMLKLGVDYMAAVTLAAGGIERGLFGTEYLFEGYDEVYKPIQDRLTPEPGSVTTAGRFISGIAGFAPALALGPAGIPVLAGTGAITTGTELVEQGVDPTTATEAAVLTGAATTVMAGIPAAGKTWGKTLALAATNPLIGAASTEAQKQLLEASGYQELAGQFDPLDPAGRGIDAVMGLAFGAMGKYGLARREMLTRTKDGIDTVANWQRMFKDTPFDVTDPKSADLGYKAMQKALADISAGKPVDLSGVLPDKPPIRTEASPARAEAQEARAEIAKALEADAKIEEHRIDADLRGHVQKLVETGDHEGVFDLVYKDALTGTYNQRGWLRLEASGGLEGKAQGKSDMVKFKYLNDTYGDKFGDEVLATAGKYLSEQPNVRVFRIGGDETAVVSTRGNAQDVTTAYENANRKLQAHTFTGTKKDGILVDIEGVSLIYGTGQNPTEAAASRKATKDALIAAGKYADERGARPLALVERPREARADLEPAQVLEVKPARPAAAKPKAQDMIIDDPAARRVEARLAEEGDFPIRTGTDVEGNPTAVSARDFIEAAKRDYKALEAQQDVYARISDCL